MIKLSSAQLASYAVDELEKGTQPTQVAQMIAAYLLENRQSREVATVMRAVEAELNRRGSTQVSITSAHEISDATKQELANLLGAQNPVFHETIDPSVIGGVKAKAGESEIDLTVHGRLQKFKAALINK